MAQITRISFALHLVCQLLQFAPTTALPKKPTNPTKHHITYYSLPGCTNGEIKTEELFMGTVLHQNSVPMCINNLDRRTRLPLPVWSAKIWAPVDGRGIALLNEITSFTYLLPFNETECKEANIAEGWKFDSRDMCLTMVDRGSLRSLQVRRMYRLRVHQGETVIRKGYDGKLEFSSDDTEDSFSPAAMGGLCDLFTCT